jgi:hypothetical protein
VNWIVRADPAWHAAPVDGFEAMRLPDLGNGVRGGKSAYWVTVSNLKSDREIADVLAKLVIGN